LIVRVAVNGFGTIGKRVALAVMKQDDMKLVGVVKKSPDYAVLQALKMGIDIYAPSEQEAKKLEEAGIKVSGLIEDLLGKADVVIDATPAGTGAKYKGLYEQFNLKQIYQGGEDPSVAEISFSSLCNYSEALGKRSARVVSCNTTGLLRILCWLSRYVRIERAIAFIVRRGADPKEVRRGPINSVELDPPSIPSHHAHDVRTVLPWLRIVTAAVAAPTTLMHVHFLQIRTADRSLRREDVVSALEEAPRIMLLRSGYGFSGTASIVEAAREIRPRYDVPELVIFEDTVRVEEGEIHLIQAVHQESIVVPENIDAVRALTKLEEDPMKSVEKTDRALGITKKLW